MEKGHIILYVLHYLLFGIVDIAHIEIKGLVVFLYVLFFL
jgi:hypothetical protein